MLKYIPQSWMDDMRTNYNHKFNFYLNPRCRVFPALTSTGVTYIENDKSTNMRGTYRMQCGGTTDLTYLYTLPQRFIIEGWFKPEFAYDVAGDQMIFNAGAAMQLYYSQAFDYFQLYSNPGVAINTTAFTTTEGLQKWIYVRCFFDNISKLKGFYCTVNGIIYANSQNIPAAGDFTPSNTISFFATVASESSYWIIHELDETLPTGEYKTYQADRQIFFGFNGTTLGRERIYIPRVKEDDDYRGVKGIPNIHKEVENPMSGSAGANTASLVLHNQQGQFSDDQYTAWDPFQGYYNGTQKYLQNRVPVEIESQATATINTRDGLWGHWSFDADDGTDNSGNGNALTLVGASTFAAGISGDAIVLDGATQYTRTTSVLASVPDVWHYHEEMPNGQVQAATEQVFVNYKVVSDSAGFLKLRRYQNADQLDVTYSTGAGATAINFLGFFTGYSATRVVIDVDINWTASAVVLDDGTTLQAYGVRVSRNGAYFGTATMTTPVKPTAGSYMYFGSYQGTQSFAAGTFDERRIYDRALSAAEIAYLYANPKDWGAISKLEPIFIGRTTPGAFKRNSPNKFLSEVTIDAEDGIAEIGETKLARPHAYDSYDLCDPANEGDSLVHSIVRLVTKKEIRNYALNSSGENDDPSLSWLVSGAGITLSRSNTYAQFGTYSLKCIATGAGDYVRGVIKFETIDLIDVGDTFNFSAFVRQGTASTVKIIIEELTSAGALVGTGSETACGTDIDVFTRVNVSRTILASTCTQLRITFYAVDASTFYVDGIMLTRGIDPIDYFLVNANDGASGIGSAESAATYEYDTVAFKADAVDLEHPYYLLEQGSRPWESTKEVGDASICYYLGMTVDGVFRFASRYDGTNPPNNGDVEDFGGVATSLDVNTVNSVKVHGVIVQKETAVKSIWVGKTMGGFTTDEGGELLHPIADGGTLAVSGATTIEAVYTEDGR